jgi:hypothetical protein
MRRVLEPFIVSEEPEHHLTRIEFGDGRANAYLNGDDMMANHVTDWSRSDCSSKVRGKRDGQSCRSGAPPASPTKPNALICPKG